MVSISNCFLSNDGKNLFSQLQRCKTYLDLFGAEFSEQVQPLSPETCTKKKLAQARPHFQCHLTKLKGLEICERTMKAIREAQEQASVSYNDKRALRENPFEEAPN